MELERRKPECFYEELELNELISGTSHGQDFKYCIRDAFIGFIVIVYTHQWTVMCSRIVKYLDMSGYLERKS